jgi:ATP-dependent RNA helicase RhlE
MCSALDAVGYRVPTPIQAQTIAPALDGRDIIGTAQTGTGKTAAFMIPVIERLRSWSVSGPPPRALILSPTREIAEQTHRWAERLGGDIRAALVVGGTAFGSQVHALREQPAIIIATPGRLGDHLDRKTASLQAVRMLVLDEADRMLDMGFAAQLDRIVRALPRARQTLLFSATFPPAVERLAGAQVRNAVRIEVGRLAVPPCDARQDVYLVEQGDKLPLLLSLIERRQGSILIFARTKHRTDRVTRALRHAGHAAQRLHADRSQSQRREALEGFRGGRYRVLVATDLAARGIDVAAIGHVVNYDLPRTVDDYVHRVGRTARAGAGGRASSFAAPDEYPQLRAIERHIGRPLDRPTQRTVALPNDAAASRAAAGGRR